MANNVLEQKSMNASQAFAPSLGEQRASQLSMGDDADDLSGIATPTVRMTPAKRPCPKKAGAASAGEFVEEVSGSAPLAGSSAIEGAADDTGGDDEVGTSGSEGAAAECVEATTDQFESAEAGEESAFTDLESVEGFEAPEAVAEGTEIEKPLRDAGSAALPAAESAATQEFLPILTALAPTLISTVGPMIAKGVMSKLSPRAKKVIKRLPGTVGKTIKTVSTAVKAAGGNLAVGASGASLGASNILAIIAKLLETAERSPTIETGVEVDENFVDQAVQAIESIIGTDDRVRIQNTSAVPWRHICALRIHFPGATYRGSGFFVGPRAVVTAGHCVYMHGKGWAQRIEVIPACNGTQRPYGQAVATQFRSVTGWVNGKKPENDYGCIILPAGSFGGSNVGSFGFANFTPQVLVAKPAVLAGYPGDKPFAELWGMARRIQTVTARTLVYDIDSMGGQSGAPVYIKRNGKRYVVGIHNYGGQTSNSATRIVAPVYKNLLNWSKI